MSRILVVDDESRIRALLMKTLQIKGFEVAEADNAYMALEQIEHFQPDLVLLDILMPEMSGLDLLQRIKTLHADLCVIMLTGMNDMKFGKEAMELGADDYLTKPVKIEQLYTVLDVHLLFQETEKKQGASE